MSAISYWNLQFGSPGHDEAVAVPPHAHVDEAICDDVGPVDSALTPGILAPRARSLALKERTWKPSIDAVLLLRHRSAFSLRRAHIGHVDLM